MPEFRVLALYRDLISIYADRGNLLLLQRRCAWRGIGFSLLDDDLERLAHLEARHAAGI